MHNEDVEVLRSNVADPVLLNFSDALVQIKAGQLVAREGWNGKSMHIFLITDWAGVSNTHGFPFEGYLDFIAMKTATGHLVPWLASQTDILAEDWVVLA